MFRMLACDLDGTLLKSNGEMDIGTVHRLRELWHQGVQVVIATGRSWRTALKIQQLLGTPGPIVAHNGAYAFDTRTGQEIYSRRVPAQAARTMLAWADSRHIMLRCYLGMGHPVLFNFFTPTHLDRFLRADDVVVSDLHRTLNEDPLEIFLFGTWEVDSFLNRFGQQGPGYELVVFPHGDTREVNICAPGADKVEGVAACARRLGIARKDILVIGDGLNDVRLMRWAGLSVAMGTGHEIAKSVANYTTREDHPEPVQEAINWALARFMEAKPVT